MVATVRIDYFDAFGVFQRTEAKQIQFKDLKEIEEYCQKKVNKVKQNDCTANWYIMEVKQ